MLHLELIVLRLVDTALLAGLRFRGSGQGGIFKLLSFGSLAFRALRWFLGSRYGYKGDPAFSAYTFFFDHCRTSQFV